MARDAQEVATHPPRMVALDLDGTLLTTDRVACQRALERLDALGKEHGVIRVAATGRNVMAAAAVLPPEPSTPIDYVVAGSGGIVLEWPSMKMIARNTMDDVALPVARALVAAKVPFMLLEAPPDNHKCFHYLPEGPANIAAGGLEDIHRRLNGPDHKAEHARAYSEELVAEALAAGEGMGQFLLIGLEDVDAAQRLIEAAAPPGSVRFTRLTAMGAPGRPWLEVFPSHVSKAEGLRQVARLHGLGPGDCLAIGNDWNDLDMLEWASRGVLMANTPECMQQHAREQLPHVDVIAHTNDQHGALRGLEQHFGPSGESSAGKNGSA